MTRKEISPTLQPRAGRSGYQLSVPLSEQEYWAVVHRARVLGIARSEYVRRCMFGEYGNGLGAFYFGTPIDELEGMPDDHQP